jgi:hypothetical protein
MTPRTLRRKLQKKKKHKPYRRCAACGGRMECRLVSWDDRAGLVAWLPWLQGTAHDVLVKECRACKRWEQLFWTGGGKSADTLPTGGR